MRNIGAAENRHCLPSLLRLSTVGQDRGCALGLLYFAAVQRSFQVGRDHLIPILCLLCTSVLRIVIDGALVFFKMGDGDSKQLQRFLGVFLDTWIEFESPNFAS
jgi:hypothetical protein